MNIFKSASALALEEFGDSYRGYTFKGLSWSATDPGFAVHAYMANSPIHPLDLMYHYEPNPPTEPETLKDFVVNSVVELKALIDGAHDDPGSLKKEAA